jgi:hypothetical protein
MNLKINSAISQYARTCDESCDQTGLASSSIPEMVGSSHQESDLRIIASIDGHNLSSTQHY